MFDLHIEDYRKTNKGGPVLNTIRIYGISFHSSFPLFYILAPIVVLAYYLGFYLIIYRKNPSGLTRNSGASLEHTPVFLPDYREGDFRQIDSYIQEHYYKPDFTIHKLSRITGFYNKKISSLLKKKYGFTFIRLINQLRITEARRLLKETSRTILDIAFAVGFNSISHFNRVFKKFTRSSAGQYRQKHPEKK